MHVIKTIKKVKTEFKVNAHRIYETLHVIFTIYSCVVMIGLTLMVIKPNYHAQDETKQRQTNKKTM